MRTNRVSQTDFNRALRSVLIDLDRQPEQFNLARLSADLRRSVADSGHMFPAQIARALAGRFERCVDAYRLHGATGMKLPAHDNVNPHVPPTQWADELEQTFHFDQWCDAVEATARWVRHQTGEPATGWRLEQALTDFLIELPELRVGTTTAKMLAGRFGMEAFLDALNTHYSPGAGADAHWFGDDDLDDDVDVRALDLNGGHFR